MHSAYVHVAIVFIAVAGLGCNCTRRSIFFQKVRSELQTRFAPHDILRIYRFCEYANTERNMPPPKAVGHVPCEEYVENLTAFPYWDPTQFPWVAELENNAYSIYQELCLVQGNGIGFKSDSRCAQTMGTGWAAVRLQRFGQWSEHSKLFPTTVSIVEKLNIPVATRGIMFARQSPHSGVAPHSDGRNFILTAHLGLNVPAACWIEVGGVRRTWADQKALVLDTSFTHQTANDSDEERTVLIIDFGTLSCLRRSAKLWRAFTICATNLMLACFIWQAWCLAYNAVVNCLN